MIILTKIKIRNQTNIPLFVQDIGSAIKLPDGSEQTNVAASNQDMNRVFQAYPSVELPARGPDSSRHYPFSGADGRGAGNL